MNQWVTIADYAELHEITTQAVYKRIKAGNIPENRIRTNDGGKKEILNPGISILDKGASL